MKQIYCMNSAIGITFIKYSNIRVGEAIGEYLNINCMSVEQQDLILDEWEKYMYSNSPEKKFLKLSMRKTNIAQNKSVFEQMVEIFELAGHAGENATDVDTFVQVVVSYPLFFACETGEITIDLIANGSIGKFSNEIDLFNRLCDEAETLDFDYLVFGALLDWISTKILTGAMKTKE